MEDVNSLKELTRGQLRRRGYNDEEINSIYNDCDDEVIEDDDVRDLSDSELE